jgi:hydroxymethylbilane synthase
VSRPSNLIVLGTRGSGLALAQSRQVAARLGARHENLTIELQTLKTDGDIQQQRALGPGDRGVFVRTIELALLAGDIDFAVHSLKDLPSGETPGLVIGAVPAREDPRDALVSLTPGGLIGLPESALVGTGSPRRRSQLLLARPDLRVESLRGNIDTRAARVSPGDLDAVVLAAAGLIRLGLQRSWETIDPDVCFPAVAQGALALQARADDRLTVERLRVLEDPATRVQVDAERAFLAELGGGCMAPATAWARQESGRLRIDAMVASPDGEHRFVESWEGDPAEATHEARRLAQRLNDRGAQHWLEMARKRADENAGQG